MKSSVQIKRSPRKVLGIALITSLAVIALLLSRRVSWKEEYYEWINKYQSSGAQIDTNEFAPGHPNVTITALQQLRSYPLPRYAPGHKLLPNVQWMAPNYFAGAGQKGVTQKQVVDTSVAIQLELASNWHYYLLLPGNTKGSPSLYNDSTALSGAWIKLANQHPELPASVITFWAQLNPKVAGFYYSYPYIVNRDLPPAHYVAAFQNVKGRKKLSPAAPLDSFKQDGLTQRFFLEKLLAALKRPVDLVNENGEIFSPYDPKLLEDDPAAVADMKRLKITDPKTYQAYGRTRIECAYRDAFMSLPGLSKTLYTEYAIDGHETYREKYSEVRKINSPINGQYYATPDFYPRWPSNWEKWSGAWHGIKWITDSRKSEIALGDELFSPYVAAGWDANEENNIRPAQWLGLLKALGMMGAEFYYTGLFNLQAPYATPANYAWQAVMPCYAQAVTSRYEDILRNGTLTNGPSYRYDTGNSSELVFIRKHNALPIYAITGSIQRSSNEAGAAPSESIVSVKLDKATLKFKIRQQGSTYIYDLTDPSHPVFFQLDAWHESLHPSRWSKDFLFEAEVNDGHTTGCKIVTETPARSSPGDYSLFTSYISFTSDKDTLKFIAEPRGDAPLTYYMWIKARGTKGRSAGLLVSVGSAKAETRVKDNEWRWYRVKIDASLKPGKNVIAVWANEELQVDQLLLSTRNQAP